MFSVVKTGGKQYRVSPGTKIRVEKLSGEEGERIFLEHILLKYDGKSVVLGAPEVKGEKIEAKILKNGRDKKKIVFKYKSKTRRRTKKGHRQEYTELEIVKI